MFGGEGASFPEGSTSKQTVFFNTTLLTISERASFPRSLIILDA
jgi:hypothetical protein